MFSFIKKIQPKLFKVIKTWNKICSLWPARIVLRLLDEIHRMELHFIKMQTIFTFSCQLLYFILCDYLLHNQETKLEEASNKTIVTALTTILLYTVFGYFATRVKDVFVTSRYPASISHSGYNCITSIFKVILEWAKAVIIVLCIKEQGINYTPKPLYAALTLTYYLCSEKIFCEIFSLITEQLSFDYFENLEYLYMPLYLNIYTILSGLLLITYSLILNSTKLAIVSFYLIVFLRIKDSYCNYWQLIVTERKTYSSFRSATEEEITERDDICAVCLNKMSRARITPCNHLFHPICLKQCLKNSYLCPLCKYNFKLE